MGKPTPIMMSPTKN